MARTMLERAVSKARPLQNVRIRELEHMKATGGPGWTLTQYVELLKDASATMERERSRTGGRARREANSHESGLTDTNTDPTPDVVQDYQAWVTRQQSVGFVLESPIY